MNAQRAQRTRPATSAVSQDTSPVTAPTQPLRELVVEAVVDSHPVVDPKSATSAARSATSPETAQRLVVTVDNREVVTVDSREVVTVEDTEVVVVVAKVVRPATPAVVTATCLVTAPKVRSATTVVRLAICPETAHPRPHLSVLATSASSQVTSRLNAQTKLLRPNDVQIHRPKNRGMVLASRTRLTHQLEFHGRGATRILRG